MAEITRVLGKSYTTAQANSLVDLSGSVPINTGSLNPLHTLYGGAHLFQRDSFERLGSMMDYYQRTYLPNPHSIMLLLELAGREVGALNAEQIINETFQLLLQKIATNPVEDFRIDFEDGFGYHTDEEENAVAQFSAIEAAFIFTESKLPSRFGIRIKSLFGSTCARAMDTLDIFLSTFLDSSGGKLPKGFVVTLPKITCTAEVELLCETLAEFEFRAGLKLNTIRIELMIEEPSIISDTRGNSQIQSLLKAGTPRIIGLHIGIYDYLSALGIPAGFQIYTHPLANTLRQEIVISTNTDPISIVDGVTNTLPVEVFRGKDLSSNQKDENKATVFRGWSEHIFNVNESLRYGIFQGWDIHPAQCIARYIAVYLHLIESRDSTINRMKKFISNSTKPTQSKGVFDDAATIRGLLVYLKIAAKNSIVTDANLAELNLTKKILDLPSVDILKRLNIS